MRMTLVLFSFEVVCWTPVLPLLRNGGKVESESHLGMKSSGPASLPDPVGLQTEEQTLEREQNERDVLS